MLLSWLAVLAPLAAGQIQLDVTSDDSIRAAAKFASQDMMTYYLGNQPGQIPGILVAPYYWWEAGAMFGELVHYWAFTGDTQYNNLTSQALSFQGGNNNYMPANQTKDLGNDDQAAWAFSAMDAAETGFENPTDGQPSWTSLAQGVWNTQVTRWDPQTCNGGIRWQIYSFNPGYNYKNTITNGGFFQLSARLARYTGNQTYADWAEKSWEWIASTPIIAQGSVWDGIYIENCSAADQIYWTYNVGTMMLGAAYMYNHTNGNATWQQRLTEMYDATSIFFVDATTDPSTKPAFWGDIMSEIACEQGNPQTCDQDQPAFKGYLARWMATTAQLAPFLAANITSRLTTSAQAAAQQCSGRGSQNLCGRRWYQSEWDGFTGVGEQMSAMSVFMSLLYPSAKAPLSLATGGTSTSNPSAGVGTDQTPWDTDPVLTRPITGGDQFGAAVLTILGVVLVTAGSAWIVL